MDLRQRVAALEQAVVGLARLEFYSEDEERDDHGRWTSGGGTDPSNGTDGLVGGQTVDAFLAAHPQKPGEEGFAWQGRIAQALSPEDQSELVFHTRELYPGVPYIKDGVDRWCAEHGLDPPPSDTITRPVDLAEGEAVGAYFEQHKDDAPTPEVKAAYDDFKQQSNEMYDFMTKPESEGGMGVKVDFVTTPTGNPYATAAEQAADLRDNHHIAIEHGLGGAHEATMTADEYDRFRAVHDTFGHTSIGSGFDRHGEYEAWLVHSAMYTGAGRDAMSTEYHGVNSALWGGAPGTPGTGESILLPHEYSIPPWERDAVTAAAMPAPSPFIGELIKQVHFDPDFAQRFDHPAMH